MRATRPDLILTVHPMFVGAVIDSLEKGGLDIPVVGFERLAWLGAVFVAAALLTLAVNTAPPPGPRPR